MAMIMGTADYAWEEDFCAGAATAQGEGQGSPDRQRLRRPRDGVTQGGVNPMIQAEEAIRAARGLIGTSVQKRWTASTSSRRSSAPAPGGDKRYTTAGTNALWDSDSKCGRYRDLTWKQAGISGAKPGMLAFMGVGTGDVSHTGLVTEQGTVIHSKQEPGRRGRNRADGEGRGGTGWACIATSMSGEKPTRTLTADIQVGTKYIVCAQTGLRMRKKPDIRGEYMQMLPDGAVITVLERAGRLVQDDLQGIYRLGQRGVLLQSYGQRLRRRYKKREAENRLPCA